jgi:glutathione S-transferase
MTLALYDLPGSPNARKVRLLAAELGIPYRRVEVDQGKLQSREYLRLNPNGMVPTINEDGFVLWESAAILKYLAAKHPERGLLPSGQKDLATVDQWLFWFTAHVEPALDQLAWERRIKPYLGKPGHDPTLIAAAEAALNRFLLVLEKQVTAKDYILDKLTVVDFAAGPRLEQAPTFLQFDLFHYPNVIAWLERLQKKPYWKDA